MVVNEIWFDMKDGRKALIRSPREEDIPGMLDYLLLSAGETEFILRYPEDKTDITGIGYEPWHYRYVGKEIAEDIYRQGICLEEYLKKYK